MRDKRSKRGDDCLRPVRSSVARGATSNGMRQPVCNRVKIYYHHTDAGGVVYYARYLEFLEEARTLLLAERGVSVQELAGQGILFVVARQEIDYKSPAFYADTLRILTRLSKLGTASMEFECRIINQHERLIALAKTTLVCIGGDFKPRAIPAEAHKKLS